MDRRKLLGALPAALAALIVRPKPADAQTAVVERAESGDVDIGGGGWSRERPIPQLYWRNRINKLYVRSAIIQEGGDSGELGLRRAGPDGEVNDYFPAPLTAMQNGQVIGHLWWEAFGHDDEARGDQGFNGGWSGRINVRLRETPTAGRRGASMHFAVAPLGSNEPRDVLELRPDGELHLTDVADRTKAGRLRVRAGRLQFFSNGAWRNVRLG